MQVESVVHSDNFVVGWFLSHFFERLMFFIKEGEAKFCIDIVMIILFGICLPTFDIYSDLAFCINYCNNIYVEGHSLPKVLTVIPILIPLIFTVPHWWRLEGNFRNRCLTLPFLLVSWWLLK